MSETAMTTFVGWIEAPESDKQRLTDLGVYGPMHYSCFHQCFESCRTQLPAIKRLLAGYPGFFPGSFTAVGASDEMLPPKQQVCWMLGSAVNTIEIAGKHFTVSRMLSFLESLEPES